MAFVVYIRRFCKNNDGMMLRFINYDKPEWRCNLKSCREKTGARSHTWFEGSHLNFLIDVRFMYCWCHEMTSDEFCNMKLKMNQNTVIDWNIYMREICACTLLYRLEVKLVEMTEQ